MPICELTPVKVIHIYKHMCLYVNSLTELCKTAIDRPFRPYKFVFAVIITKLG